MKKVGFFRLLSGLTVLGLLVGLLTGCGGNAPVSKDAEALTPDREQVQISALGGIAKVDSIDPGLDTYVLDTSLLDLETGKVLGSASLGEGAWISGQTTGGFYAIDGNKKELRLYDTAGTCRKKQTIDTADPALYFAALSEDERYFAYANTAGDTLTVLDMTQKTQQAWPIPAPLRETLSFKDGTLRAVTLQNEVMTVKVATGECGTAIADSRLNRHAAVYSMGTTDYNFLLVSDQACLYVPFTSVDEVVVGIGPAGFATAVATAEGYLLRDYNVKREQVAQWKLDDPVESVCYAGDRLLAVTDGAAKNAHRLQTLTVTKAQPLAVHTRDIPQEDLPAVQQAETYEVPAGAGMVKKVPLIAQFPEYPTGCESVCAVMALQYANENVSVDTFVEEYLPKSHRFYTENGRHCGPSPYEYFVGHPRSTASYGCMAPVIEKAVAAYYGDDRRVQTVTGSTLYALSARYIDRGIPVLTWVTIAMIETVPTASWYLEDGKRFTWPGNEHCMLLVGYDENYYYFNDPYQGKQVRYPKALSESRFAELGRQAVVILPAADTAAAPTK